MKIEILPLTHDDIPAADRVLTLAFGRSGNWSDDLRFYMAMQPDGWLKAAHDGVLVGTVGAVDYGPFAWIGLMSVHPDQQSQGIGRLLMDHIMSWLERRGCPLARLDATPAGARLYRKLGFVNAGNTHVYQKPESMPVVDVTSTYNVSTAGPADLADIAALDESIFGVSRSFMLDLFMNELPGRFLIARAKSGELAGYLVAQNARLGPWICLAPRCAEALLQRALVLPFASPPRLIAPDENSSALRILERLGFVSGSPHEHMVKGTYTETASSDQGKSIPSVPGKREFIYAQASYGLG